MDNITAETITLHLSCHCRTYSSTYSLPSSAFPLKSAICHCSICRHATGHIFATFAVIPHPQKPDCTGLTSFDTSKELSRWFCSTCGCSIWHDDRERNEWEFSTSVINGVTYDSSEPVTSRGPGSPDDIPDVLKLIDGLLTRVQLYVGSTGDGGAAIWLNSGKLRGTERHLDDRPKPGTVDDEDLQGMVQAARAKAKDSSSLPIPLKCACGLIKLQLTRPDASTRYQAGLDACWSCRKTTGSEITSWATAPWAHFTWADGRPVTLKEDVFTQYVTTPGVMTRYFCPGCGVQVFCHRKGDENLDIGVGILDGRAVGEGSRVEGWLSWTKYGNRFVRDVVDAIDREFVEQLVEGVRSDKKASS